MKDGKERLSALTIALHWLIAIAIVAMLAIGLIMDDMARGPDRTALLDVHKSLGTAVLVLVALRILWRWRNGFPVPVGPLPRWQHQAARAVHWLLLVATLLMPLSGMVMTVAGGHALPFFGLTLVDEGAMEQATLREIGDAMHGTLAWILMALIAVHLLAALKHHLVDRDATLRRMLGGRAAS